jgi:hypothetical protein
VNQAAPKAPPAPTKPLPMVFRPNVTGSSGHFKGPNAPKERRMMTEKSREWRKTDTRLERDREDKRDK